MEKFLNNLENGVLVLGNSAKVEFANDEAQKTLGYTMNEIKKLTLIDILQDKYSEVDIRENKLKEIKTYIKTKDGDLSKVKLKISKNQWKGEEVLFIVIITMEQYEKIYAEEDVNNVSKGIEESSSIKIGISELYKELYRKNQIIIKELREEFHKRQDTEQELEEFLNTAMDIMAITGKDSRIIKINEEASRILGWTQDELYNMRWNDIIHPDCSESTVEDVKSIMSNNNIKTTRNKYINKYGKIGWLEWRSKYIKDKGVIISTAKDITERKKLEEAQIEYEKALQMESIKTEFFSNISHEFKTPLNIILATMQVIDVSIKKNKLIIGGEVDFNKYQKSIVQNSYRLLRLVNNLIDMTKIDMGYYKLCLENKNIIYIIEDITMSVAEYIENKGIELIFDTDVEEVVIACDAEKIERIMLNLLSNAIKYIEDDGKINVNITTTDNEVIVSVKDNGIGIPKEKLAIIFQRFVQVDNVLTRKCEGSGIGLSIVKSLIDLHGGSITVKSEEDKGTEFIFTLPITTVNYKNNCCENSIKTRIEKCNIEFSDIYR